MEEFKKLVNSYRKIKPKTLKVYCKSINKLNNLINKQDYQSNEIFKNTEKVMKIINENKLHTRKMYLCALLIALSPKGKNKPSEDYTKAYKVYNENLQACNMEYMKERVKQKKNMKEKKNWIEFEELNEYSNSLYDKAISTFNNLKTIQKAVVANLYTKLPPRRSCYASCTIITQEMFRDLVVEEETIKKFEKIYEVKPNENYYVVSQHNYLIIDNVNEMNPLFFSMGNLRSKVKITNKDNLIDINEMACKLDIQNESKLFVLLRHLLKTMKNTFNMKVINQPLLYDRKGNQMTSNGLSKYVASIFNLDGRVAGISMCRHIYISHVYKQNIGLLKKLQLAYNMNHSVKVAESVYAKRC